MKKVLLSIISLILCCCFMLSGCSKDVILSFKANFLGENANGTYEELTYAVNYEDRFGTEFIKDDTLTKDLIDFDYEGTYKTVWEQVGAVPSTSTLLGVNISSNVVNEEATKFYKLISALEIQANYLSINGKTPEVTTYNDFIKTETYFASINNSFAPIFAGTSASYTFIGTQNNSAFINKTSYKFYTTYNKDSYKSYRMLEQDDSYSLVQDNEYSFRSVIDNTQLLFLLRNLDFEKTDSTVLPTVSMQYDKPIKLSVQKAGGTHERYLENETLKINGNEFDDGDEQTTTERRISVNRIEFLINTALSAGSKQIVFMQNAKVGNLANTALPIRYVQPLVAYGSYKRLGVMSYKLIDCTTIKPN